MEKRGQVTTFMIIGLVIIIAIIVLFFFKNSIYESILGEQATRNILNNKIESIDRHIKQCVEEETRPALILLGKQGGNFDPVDYILFKDNKISYLCFQIPESEMCENHMLTEKQLEDELYGYLFERLQSCIDVNSFRDDNAYDINVGEFDFDININDENVLFNVTYPLTLERKGVRLSVENFDSKLDIPLGLIQDAVKDILESESNLGVFDPVGYTLTNGNEYVIYVYKVYPDTIYKVKQKDSNYEFQFAIKGVREHE